VDIKSSLNYPLCTRLGTQQGLDFRLHHKRQSPQFLSHKLKRNEYGLQMTECNALNISAQRSAKGEASSSTLVEDLAIHV
jgi:hypothetical protein